MQRYDIQTQLNVHCYSSFYAIFFKLCASSNAHNTYLSCISSATGRRCTRIYFEYFCCSYNLCLLNPLHTILVHLSDLLLIVVPNSFQCCFNLISFNEGLVMDTYADNFPFFESQRLLYAIVIWLVTNLN